MIKYPATNKLVMSLCLSLVLLSCASAPESDKRPAIVISAEKSLELGVTNYTNNNFSKARNHFEQALYLYRNIDNPQGITTSYLNLAKTLLATGQLEAAIIHANNAKKVIEREQLHPFDYNLVLIQSSIAIENGEIEYAKQLLDKLLESSITDTSITTAALQNRTRVALIESSPDLGQWIDKYRVALNSDANNTALNKARLLRFEAAVDKNNSEHKLREALNIYRQFAHTPGIAATLEEWAEIEINSANFHEAENRLKRALFIRSNLNDKIHTRKILIRLSTTYNKLGEIEKESHAKALLYKLDNTYFADWDKITDSLTGLAPQF